MLESLSIKNYVLISHLELDLSQGLSVITGETGSGKSIILGALSLILGEKADKEAVRLGANQAEISAVFSVDKGSAAYQFLLDNDISFEDDEILVKRIIKDNGRNIIKLGDSVVSRSVLEEFGFYIVEVSSQHAHQALLKDSEQLKIVDRYASSEKNYAEYKESFLRFRNLEAELERFDNLSRQNSQEEDYIRFCVDEINKVNPRIGEDDEIAAELEKLNSSEVLIDSIEEVIGYIEKKEENVLTSLNRALMMLDKAVAKDSSLGDYSARMESCLIELNDIGSSLTDYLASFNFSPQDLDAKNERLSSLQRLKKKYGASLELVLKTRDELEEKLGLIDNAEDKRIALEKELSLAKQVLAEKAAALTALRKEKSLGLSREIEQNLKQLGMENARFVIEVNNVNYSVAGADEIVFKIAANKGEKFGPISQIASGGELSRIMLAVKVALNKYDDKSTLIFDEVDAGIGGTVALSVANMLTCLGENHQVIVITHLAQIASKASNHYKVVKREVDGRTLTNIDILDDDERVKEIARLLSGEISDISTAHARELLKI